MANTCYYTQLIGEVTDTKVTKLVEDLNRANADSTFSDIVITLMSYGGDILFGIGLYDQIKASTKPITIIAQGVCMSIAVTILQAATNRFARANTLFMVHPSISSLEERSYPEFISIVDQYKKNHDLFINLTIGRSGMTKDEFESIYNPRKYLTPLEARHFGRFGLIDQIL